MLLWSDTIGKRFDKCQRATELEDYPHYISALKGSRLLEKLVPEPLVRELNGYEDSLKKAEWGIEVTMTDLLNIVKGVDQENLTNMTELENIITKTDLENIVNRAGREEIIQNPEWDKIIKRIIWAEFLKQTDADPKDPLMYISKYNITQDLDTPMINASAVLSTMLVLTKDLYDRNPDLFMKYGAQYRYDDFLADDDLAQRCFSPSMMSDMGLGRFAEHEQLARTFAQQFLVAIEDEFYFLNHFDPWKSNGDYWNFITDRTKNIARYAKLGEEAAPVFAGYHLQNESGAFEKLMIDLQKTDFLEELVGKEQTRMMFERVLNMHAYLNNLSFNNDSYPYNDLVGYEINAFMQIMKIIHRQKNVGEKSALTGKKKPVVMVDNMYVYSETEKDLTLKNLKELCHELASDIAPDDVYNSLMLNRVKAFHRDLDERMFTVGMGFDYSKEFATTLYSLTLGCENTSNISKFRGNDLLMFQEIIEDGPDYPSAMSYLMEKISGKRTAPTSYRNFNLKEGFESANYITPVTYITRIHNGKIRIVDERVSKLDEKLEAEHATTQFSGPHHDIYVRTNKGVCLILETNGLEFPFNPRMGFLESREDRVTRDDILAQKPQEWHLDAHEFFHNKQQGDQLIWKDLLAYVTYAIAEIAYRSTWDETFYDEFAYQVNARHVLRKGETLKDLCIRYLDAFTVQAVGKGKFAEKLRSEGLYDGCHEEGIGLDADGWIDGKKLRNTIECDKCTSYDLSQKLRTALVNNKKIDMDTLLELHDIKEKSLDYAHEIQSILETSAEAFSAEGVGDIITNLDIPEDKKTQCFESLYDGMTRRGELAIQYMEIVNATTDPNEDGDYVITDEAKELLKQKGMKYQKVITGLEEDELKQKLIDFDYDQQDPYDALSDFEKFSQEMRKIGDNPDDYLIPMNSAKAVIGIRYSTKIPDITKLIEKMTSQEAHQFIANVDSWKDIDKKLETYERSEAA